MSCTDNFVQKDLLDSHASMARQAKDNIIQSRLYDENPSLQVLSTNAERASYSSSSPPGIEQNLSNNAFADSRASSSKIFGSWTKKSWSQKSTMS